MKIAAIVEYGPDKEQVKAHHLAHREYLRRLLDNEQLRAAGPLADDAGALWVFLRETRQINVSPHGCQSTSSRDQNRFRA